MNYGQMKKTTLSFSSSKLNINKTKKGTNDEIYQNELVSQNFKIIDIRNN